MHILVHHLALSEPTQTFVNREIVELQKRCRVHVLGQDSGRQIDLPFSNVNLYPQKTFLERHIIDTTRKANLHYRFWYPSRRKVIQSLMDAYSFDIIHTHFGTMSLILWDNLPKKWKRRIPIFIHFHGYDASKRLVSSSRYRKRMTNILKEPNVHPIFVSENMYRHVCDLGLEPDKKRILYYGIETDKYGPEPEHYLPETYKLLQISTLREKKGHIYTLRALRKYIDEHPDQDVIYFIGGSGPIEKKVRNEVKTLKLENHVEFLGWLNQREVRQWMNRVDVFIHHSVTSRRGDKEGIPNVLIEAMAMEIPVLSTYHAGIPELVEDGIHGLLCEERDVDELARQIAVIKNWGRISANRVKVEKQFDIRLHTDQLMQYYREEL